MKKSDENGVTQSVNIDDKIEAHQNYSGIDTVATFKRNLAPKTVMMRMLREVQFHTQEAIRQDRWHYLT